MNDNHCRNCAHYIQHYTFIEGSLRFVSCGHCPIGSPKRRKPNAQICDRFTPGAPCKEKFVTKDYLTKELLRYILDMELLPNIEEP